LISAWFSVPSVHLLSTALITDSGLNACLNRYGDGLIWINAGVRNCHVRNENRMNVRIGEIAI
jgi:hypothetical protein